VEAFIITRSTAEADQVRVALTTTVADAGAASLSLGFQVLSVSKVVFAPMMSFSPPIPPSVEEPSTGTPPPSPTSTLAKIKGFDYTLVAAVGVSVPLLVCMLVCLFVRLSRRRRTRSSDANVARVGAAEHNRRTDTVQFKIGQANPPSPPGTPPGVMPPKLADRLKRMGSSSHSSFSKLPIHGEDPDL